MYSRTVDLGMAEPVIVAQIFFLATAMVLFGEDYIETSRLQKKAGKLEPLILQWEFKNWYKTIHIQLALTDKAISHALKFSSSMEPWQIPNSQE